MNFGPGIRVGAQNLFNQVARLVEHWIPTKKYGHETKFSKELQQYLDEKLNESRGGGLMLGQQEEHVVSREHGSSKADVAVDGVIGIELKRNLTNSQNKKLRGQIEDYFDHYNYVIVCACGIDDMSGWRKLKKKYSQPSFGLSRQIVFVHKKKENYGKEPQQGRGYGSGFF